MPRGNSVASTKQRSGRRRHTPQRTCVICRQVADKRSMTRVVRLHEQRIEIDPTGKLNGRGAYICDNPDCWNQAITQKFLDKALRMTLTAADRELLRTAMPGNQE